MGFDLFGRHCVITFWIAFGFVGNLLFASRFVVQWIASERAGRSVIPASFWLLSLAGGLILLTYAVYLRNPVFILAYLPNSFIYIRNLMLVKREKDGQRPNHA
jgi:lipid-A-disaccharide synthase-like uncharacterized protein